MSEYQIEVRGVRREFDDGRVQALRGVDFASRDHGRNLDPMLPIPPAMQRRDG